MGDESLPPLLHMIKNQRGLKRLSLASNTNLSPTALCEVFKTL